MIKKPGNSMDVVKKVYGSSLSKQKKAIKKTQKK